MSRQRPGGVRQPAKRKAPFSRGMQLATAIGLLVVCAMVATSLGTVWLDRQAPAPLATAEPTPDPGHDYENLLRAQLQQNPKDARSAVSLANLLAARQDYEAAIPLYAQALEIEPANGQYRKEFALALFQKGALPDAELQYQKALEQNPNDAEALYFLGQVYASWNPPRIADARSVLERAITAEPDSVSATQASEALARLNTNAPEATPVATEGS